MFWQRTPDKCQTPLGGEDGPPCGKPLNGGAILVCEDGTKTGLCHAHMTVFLQVVIQTMEAYAE